MWAHEWETTYRMLMASYAVGPRSTPTVDGDRVYAVGATGRLFCLDVETGDVIWAKDYIEEYDTSIPTWGIASSPLVDGDKLITVVGGEGPPGGASSFSPRERRFWCPELNWSPGLPGLQNVEVDVPEDSPSRRD